MIPFLLVLYQLSYLTHILFYFHHASLLWRKPDFSSPVYKNDSTPNHFPYHGKKLRTVSRSQLSLTDQPLSNQYYKANRSRHLYHLAKREDSNYHFRLIFFIIIECDLILIFFDSFCLFLKMRKRHQYPFQRISFVNQFKNL